jgi:hypothetical protein
MAELQRRLSCTRAERDLLDRIERWVGHVRRCQVTPCEQCEALGQLVVLGQTVRENVDLTGRDLEAFHEEHGGR